MTLPNEPYTIRPARYAKGQFIITPQDSQGGYKGRVLRLVGDGLNCRYSGRCGGYVASPSKVAKFERLYANGWDANFISGELCPPVETAQWTG